MDKSNPKAELQCLTTTKEQLCEAWWQENGELLPVPKELKSKGIVCIYRTKPELRKNEESAYLHDFFVKRDNGTTCYCWFGNEQSMYDFLNY